MKRLNNQKGAALISVMIAITFISIVSTTLLLISLNNYQMKVANTNSKENFYETEQRLNIVTAHIRDEMKNSTNVTGDLRTLLGGVTTDSDYTHDTYSGSKIAELAFPNPSSDVSVSGANVTVCVNPDETDSSKKLYDHYYFYDGDFDIIDRTAGKEIVVNDVKVKQVNSSGYENTIKTDINFYLQIPNGSSGAGGGVGSCSFILDSSIELCSGNSNPDKSTRLNIYGNTIFGKYTLVSGSYSTDFKDGAQLDTPETLTTYSVPNTLDKTMSGTTVSKIDTSNSNKSKAVIYLREFSCINYLGDNNVIFGDIYLADQALLNIVDGTFTCYGDIFVADKAAFVCKGDLKLGVNCGIYSVASNGNCTKITTSTPAKNIIFDSYDELDKLNYDKMADHLKLFDDNGDNDGILPNILVKASPLDNTDAIAYNTEEPKWMGSYWGTEIKNHPVSELSTNSVDDMYCYDLADAYHANSDYFCTFDGISYRATVPEGDLNNNYENQLILVNNHTNGGNTRITQNIPNSTIISKNPVYCYDTHGVCVTKMGEQAFNYFIDENNGDTVRMNLKSFSGSNLKQFRICDFFDIDSSDGADCNSFVMTVFNLSTGDDTSGGPKKPTKTRVNYTNWIKDEN